MRFFIVFLFLILMAEMAHAQFDPDYDEPEEDQDTTQTEQPQEPEKDEIDYKPSFLERVYVGGNVGLSLGTNFFFADLSPLAGYDVIAEVWSVGIGATYRYQRLFGNNLNIYGGRLFTRVNIPNTFFVHLEYEYLSYIPRTIASGIGERTWDGNVLVGGGIWFNKSANGGFYLSILYALNTEQGSLYENNPFVISPGFVFYLK